MIIYFYQICFRQLKKDKGNWWYARNEYTMALHVYRKALQYFGESGEIVCLHYILLSIIICYQLRNHEITENQLDFVLQFFYLYFIFLYQSSYNYYLLDRYLNVKSLTH